MTADRRIRVIALPILNLGSRWGGVVKATLRPPYQPYLLYRKLEESRAGPNSLGEHKITRPYRSSNFDRSTYSDSLYRLGYLGMAPFNV